MTSHKARKKLDQANQSEMDAKLRDVRAVLFPEPVCFGQRWPKKIACAVVERFPRVFNSAGVFELLTEGMESVE